MIVDSLIKLKQWFICLPLCVITFTVPIQAQGKFSGSTAARLCSQRLYQSLDSRSLPHWYFKSPIPPTSAAGMWKQSTFFSSHIAGSRHCLTSGDNRERTRGYEPYLWKMKHIQHGPLWDRFCNSLSCRVDKAVCFIGTPTIHPCICPSIPLKV